MQHIQMSERARNDKKITCKNKKLYVSIVEGVSLGHFIEFVCDLVKRTVVPEWGIEYQKWSYLIS